MHNRVADVCTGNHKQSWPTVMSRWLYGKSRVSPEFSSVQSSVTKIDAVGDRILMKVDWKTLFP